MHIELLKETSQRYGSLDDDFLLRGGCGSGGSDEAIPYVCRRIMKKRCDRPASRKKEQGKGAV